MVPTDAGRSGYERLERVSTLGERQGRKSGVTV